ncbi:MAG: alpha-L-fucosidase [Calditrichaeota bacterium]|nr:alpha-L-fucosidase [Calditrichota bacterium]
MPPVASPVQRSGKRGFDLALDVGAHSVSVSPLRVGPPEPLPPVPSPQQLAWQDLEFYAFVHFGMNTFTDREWGTGKEGPALFNPTELDCRQWVRVFKRAGMKGVILTAKHHDGFCLWPSKYTEHSVKNSPWRGGKGDVVKELSEACREAGLKFGVYLSPWDRHEPSYGDSPRYNRFYKNQLRELLTNYGPIFEVWFDGACGEGPNGRRQVYDWEGYWALVRRLQPNAVIFSDAGPDVRWVGNERGYADETNWSTLNREGIYPGYPHPKELTRGHEGGKSWVPAEVDVSIRPGWFYHASQDSQVKSLPKLVDIYFHSVGRNANLLLNVPPDRRGLITAVDSTRLAQFRDYLDRAFAVNLAGRAKAAASNWRGGESDFAPAKAVDGKPDTYWATDDSVRSAWLELEFPSAVSFNCVMLQEAIALGQRVRRFRVLVPSASGWQQVADGTTVGHKRLVRFEPVTTTKLKIEILDARACPTLTEVGVFAVPPPEATSN